MERGTMGYLLTTHLFLFFHGVLNHVSGDGGGGGSDLQRLDISIPDTPTDEPENYICAVRHIKEYKLPAKKLYARHIEVHPTPGRVSPHHVLLFGCTVPAYPDGIWPCGPYFSEPGSNPKKDVTILAVLTSGICRSGLKILNSWVAGMPKISYPEDTGIEFGEDTDVKTFVMEAHYPDASDMDHLNDTEMNKISIEYTVKKPPKHLGYLMAILDGKIAPNGTTIMELICEIDDDLHSVYFRVHTHARGRIVSGYRVRKMPDGNWDWTLIGEASPLELQVFRPVFEQNLVIKKGDYIAVRCVMVSHEHEEILIGPKETDEMCNYHLTYWVQEGRKSMKTCYGDGPPTYYWKTDGELKLNNLPPIPHWEEPDPNKHYHHG